MHHIDFTRWKPNEPPTIDEVARLWDRVDKASAARIRAGKNRNLEMFCHHRIDIPDPFERQGERYVMAVNVFWDDPGEAASAWPVGTCAFQVTYEDFLRGQGPIIGTYVNQRGMHLEEVLTMGHLISIGVLPSFTGIEWLPKEHAEPIEQ
ncbi:hypothetical protein [Nesterenkonia sphaerica]|uniref:Uncharacterized protein n=1 Tax=Nesterenkonia sphaerica TaxID=1804988 RepID=A0A5R9A2X1_9MICC|nr:hypothetical protein [Nesterenkonia sphaerica]TLP72952.1 hypothetical protein FEF27_11020 [Nesterenkonia sphaerica]